MWRSSYNIPKAIFYLLKGDYTPKNSQEPEMSVISPNPKTLSRVVTTSEQLDAFYPQMRETEADS